MFSLATGIYQSYFAPPRLSILIIGLDGSGKTALLERIKVTDVSARLDVDDDGVDSSSSSWSSRGAAVAGVGEEEEGEDHITTTTNGRRRRPARRGGGGGKEGRPARLPPPLPPRRSSRGRRRVEDMMVRGWFVDGDDYDDDEEEVGGGTTDDDYDDDGVRRALLLQVRPPPLFNGDVVVADGRRRPSTPGGDYDDYDDYDYGRGGGTTGTTTTTTMLTPKNDHNMKSLVQFASSSPSIELSPGFNSVTIMSTPRLPPPGTPVVSPTKLDGLVGLLSKCPSPRRYANAALLGREEGGNVGGEYYSDVDADAPPRGPWNVDYLGDYSIDYREDEEFDVIVGDHRRGGGRRGAARMLPLDRIRPTLGQNLAKLDMCGCKCSLFDLSGADKMRPMWERYYRDADAIIYVVDAAESSFARLRRSRHEFERMCQDDAVRERARTGLPIMVFANRLDVAYAEYGAGMDMANRGREDHEVDGGKGDGSLRTSWNLDEEGDFVGGVGTRRKSAMCDDCDDDVGSGIADAMISRRVVDFDDLAALFGFPRPGRGLGNCVAAADRGNVFLFGGSAKSGEGVRAAMEYLIAHARNHLSRCTRR